MATAGTLGQIKVLTQGAENSAYQYVTGGTCATSTTYAAGQACTVDYTFTPAVPGQSSGAVVLYSGSTIVAKAYLSGTGTGPQAVIYNGTQTQLAGVSGLGAASEMTTDAAGNLYVGDYTSHAFEKYGISGTSATLLSTLSLSNGPGQVTVDGLGNVFVATTDALNLSKFTYSATNGTYAGAVAVVTSPNSVSCFGGTVDVAGNAYLACGGTIYQAVLSGTTYGAPVSFLSGFSSVTAIVFDSAGNAYIADAGAGQVYKATYSSSGYGTPVVIAANLSNANGLAVDAAGDVYVSTTTNQGVTRLTPSGSSYAGSVIGSIVGSINGVALAPNGNLLVNDGASGVYLEDVADTETLTFPSTPAGSTSSASTVAVNNIGNASLTISALATSSANFTLDTATTTCATSMTLSASGSCNVGAKFTPQGPGNLTGSINITDNALNIAGAVQNVNLLGTGTQTTTATAVVAVNNASAAYGSASAALSATLSFPGSAPSGAFTFTVGSGASITATCSGGASPRTCTATYATATLPAGTYPVTASLAADTNYNAASTTGTLTIGLATTTTTMMASATTANPNQTVVLTATVGYVPSGTPTGTVTFFDNGTKLTTVALTGSTAVYATLLTPATGHMLSASYSGDNNFAPSSTPPVGVIVSVGPLELTFTPASSSSNEQTVVPGAAATYKFLVSPNCGSYPAPVSFSVVGLPVGATATFTPSTVAANGSTQTVAMTVQMPIPLSRNTNPREKRLPMTALLLLPLLGLRSVRHKLGARVLAVLLFVAGLGGAAALTGCGSGSNGFLLEQPVTYTLSVTATSGVLQHSQIVTLIVQ